jgi:hypothetical protein
MPTQDATGTLLASIDPPLPDELLGSWLARVALDNSLPDTTALLRLAGATKSTTRIDSSDNPTRNDLTESMFSRMGFGFEAARSTLSTVPYWLCFQKSPSLNEDRKSNRHGRSRSRSAVHVEGQAGWDRFLRGRPTRQLLQVCPTCLEEDEAKLGAPYFHRSHQLLGTRVCHKHGGNLMRQCPGCGASVGLASGMVLAAMNCGCGAKLWKARAGQPESEAWLLLAQFEHKALHAVTGQLAADRLIVALRGVLADKYPGPGRSSGVRALRTFFGDEGANWIQRSVVNPDRDEGSSDTPIALKDANALVLSGLSVAAGWTIETATAAALAAAKVPSTAAVEPSLSEVALSLRQKRPDNVTEARRQIDLYLERVETPSWKQARQGKGFAFWLLAVHDLEWLANRLGPKLGVRGLPSFPSISEDRATLERDADLALMNKLPGRIPWESAMRAYYRDRTWLDAQVLACEQERKEEEVSTVRDLLQAASDSWKSRPGKPQRFSLQSAAEELGWTKMTLSGRMKRASLSTDEVIETTSAFQERTIRWAIGERLRRSKSLAPSMVCLQAGIAQRPANLALASKLVASYLGSASAV